MSNVIRVHVSTFLSCFWLYERYSCTRRMPLREVWFSVVVSSDLKCLHTEVVEQTEGCLVQLLYV